MTVRIVVEEAPPESDLRAVERGLVEHATEAGIEPRQHRPLAVFARADSGHVVGGLVGDTVWGWLHVRQLWVTAAERGKGYGKALLRVAEDEAMRQGCRHAWLDTFDFQAREFYQRLGYAVFGSLADFPHQHVRFFMTRVLIDRSLP